MRFAIDAGHGGHDPGAAANGCTEKAINLSIATRLGHYLRAMGDQTVLTRDDDTFIPISKRASVAVAHACDGFLSIHCDASSSSKANGFTAYVVNGDQRSLALAQAILHHLAASGFCARHGTDDNGVRPDTATHVKRLGVLRGTYKRMPAVLLECGFLTNPKDADMLKKKNERGNLVAHEEIGSLVAEAIRQYFASHP